MAYSDAVIHLVWEKGAIDSNNDPDLWRKDQCGAWIGWAYYGDRNSQYGWEIDHITPQASGDSDELATLRPLQWENNASRQEGRLTCPVSARGNENVHKESSA